MFTNMASVTKTQLQADLRVILKGADLTQLSSKKVRKQLEEKYDQNLTERKKEIDEILLVLMQEAENDNKSDSESDDGQESSKVQNKKQNNKQASSSGDDSDFDVPTDIGPPKKKIKAVKKNLSDEDNVEADEHVARKLQEEESGGRRTRNSGKKKAPIKKKTPKKKSDGGAKSQGFTKPCLLSPALAAVMGVAQLPRSDVVKRFWEIAKERDLFDPKNRQFIKCDAELFTVFGRKRIRMFGMMKHLTAHIHKKDELL